MTENILAKIKAMVLKNSQSAENRFGTMKANYLPSKIRLKYYDQESKSSLAGSKQSALKRREIVLKTQVKKKVLSKMRYKRNLKMTDKSGQLCM